jgi:hypothetical protein
MKRTLGVAAALIIAGWALAAISMRFDLTALLIAVGVISSASGTSVGLQVLGAWNRWGVKSCLGIVLFLTALGPMVADAIFH